MQLVQLLIMLAQVHVLALVLTAAPVAAFWRLPCKAPLVVQRADPIINPGNLSQHVHTIMGGNGFGFNMTYADTQKSSCSSCTVTKDFSNYWVPSLYYKAQNGSFIAVGQNGGATIYYLQRSDEKDPEYSNGLLAFPQGFRMVAGNPLLRNYTDTVEQQAISFACLGVSGPETPGFPTQNCPDGLRIQVFFPSCWDGINLDSADHKSHMSYPSQCNSGFCPLSHPKRFISIFYEVIWNTPDFADMWYNGEQPFVLASGDSTGYGWHGDFINGWDVPTLQKAISECTSDSGVIEECNVFQFFPDQVTQGCKIPTSVDEQVDGILDALPGCNPIQSGPEMATEMTGCGAPTTIGTPEYNFVDVTVSKGFQYVGCGLDIAGQARTLNGASMDAVNMTNEICVDYCISKGFTIAGTEYSTQCFCGDNILAGREPVPGLYGDCMMPCSGDRKESCGGGAQISLYQKCSSTCRNVVYLVNNGTSPPQSSVQSGARNACPSTIRTSPSALSSFAVASTPSVSPGTGVEPGYITTSTGSYDSVVVITETRTVIPLASTPTSQSTHSSDEPQRQTVSVTITVTATIPNTYSAMNTSIASTTNDYQPLSASSIIPVLTTTLGISPTRSPNNGTRVCHYSTGAAHSGYVRSKPKHKRHR